MGVNTALANVPDTSGSFATYVQNLATNSNPTFASLTTTGGRIRNVTLVQAANYDVLATDDIIHLDYTTTGAVSSLTFSSALIAVAGRIWVIKDVDRNAAANNITIDTQGSQTIDGAATLVVATNGIAIQIYSDGSNLFTI